MSPTRDKALGISQEATLFKKQRLIDVFSGHSNPTGLSSAGLLSFSLPQHTPLLSRPVEGTLIYSHILRCILLPAFEHHFGYPASNLFLLEARDGNQVSMFTPCQSLCSRDLPVPRALLTFTQFPHQGTEVLPGTQMGG